MKKNGESGKGKHRPGFCPDCGGFGSIPDKSKPAERQCNKCKRIFIETKKRVIKTPAKPFSDIKVSKR